MDTVTSSLPLLLPTAAAAAHRSRPTTTTISTVHFPRTPLRRRRRGLAAWWGGSTTPVEEEDDEVCPVDCVTEFKTDEEFVAHLERGRATGALVVVDFYRTSCGSCKYIERVFVRLCKGSGKDGSPVVFLKHNVIDEYDELSEVAERLRIKVVPLFQFYKDGEMVESFATRDKDRIIAAIRKYTSLPDG
ncbi:hypothetical protein ACP4OV_005925 [Aristida adscensionis]